MSDVITINRKPKDWLSRTGHLSVEDSGAAQRLIDNIVTLGQYEEPPSLPDDDKLIANLLGWTVAKWRKTKNRVCGGPKPVLIADGGKLIDPEIVKEIEAAKARIERAKEKGILSGISRSNLIKAGLVSANCSSTAVRTAVQLQHEPEFNCGSTAVRTAVELGFDLLVSKKQNQKPTGTSSPPVSRERENSTTARARARSVSDAKHSFLRTKAQEIRANSNLLAMLVHDPDSYAHEVRELTGYWPSELAALVGDESLSDPDAGVNQ